MLLLWLVIRKQLQTKSDDEIPFPNEHGAGGVVLKVYQMGLLGLVMVLLLLCSVISIGVAVFQTRKVNKNRSQRLMPLQHSNTTVLSSQRTTSSTYQEMNPTAKSSDHSLKEYDSEIVYDEIPECLMHHRNTTPAVSTTPVGSNTIKLTANTAYRKGMYKLETTD